MREDNIDVTEAMKDVIAAARRMPRTTPEPGTSCTVHVFEIEAGVVWDLDKALKSLDKALDDEKYYS